MKLRFYNRRFNAVRNYNRMFKRGTFLNGLFLPSNRPDAVFFCFLGAFFFYPLLYELVPKYL